MFNLFKKGSDTSIGTAFQAAAKKGDPQAQYELGLAYAKAAQMTEASSWFQKAAKSGYAEAQYALGMCYRDGTGVDKKNVQAVKWFLLAANQGSADAAFQLGALIEGPSWGGWGKGEEPRDGEKAAGYSGDPFNKGSDSRQAAKWFCQAANAGHVEAQQKLGSLYWQKVDTDSSRNGVQKMEWYLKAVEAGDVVAEYKLFEMYYEGNGLPKDKEKALSWLCSAAEKNHAKAQYKLAWHYAGKEGDYYSVVAKDSAAAATWYRKAAELGYKEAQYELARLLAHGEGVPQDLAEAEAWAQKARQQDPKYAEPITLLAEIQTLLSNKGQGISSGATSPEVMALLREAADRGDGEAQYRLGKLHEQRQDYDQAAIWYAQAIQTSWRVGYDIPYSIRASFNLGLLYEKGLGVSQDLERSENLVGDCISWIKYDERTEDRKALFNEMLALARVKAEAGSKVVALQLAALYGRGWGKIDGNPVEEKKWNKLANTSAHAEIEENITATTSHTSPQTQTKVIQTEASGGTNSNSIKEEDVGYQVYGPAAEAGDAEAQYNLGAMYFGQNPEKAIAWLTKAAVQGYSHAFTLLGSIYGHGTGGVALDTQKAAQWYRQGADGGDAQCQYTLGYMYAEGTWVPQDDAQANYWLEKAMASGKLAQEQYNAALAYNIEVCKRMGAKGVKKVTAPEQNTMSSAENAQLVEHLPNVLHTKDVKAAPVNDETDKDELEFFQAVRNFKDWDVRKEYARDALQLARLYTKNKYYKDAISWFITSIRAGLKDGARELGKLLDQNEYLVKKEWPLNYDEKLQALLLTQKAQYGSWQSLMEKWPSLLLEFVGALQILSALTGYREDISTLEEFERQKVHVRRVIKQGPSEPREDFFTQSIQPQMIRNLAETKAKSLEQVSIENIDLDIFYLRHDISKNDGQAATYFDELIRKKIAVKATANLADVKKLTDAGKAYAATGNYYKAFVSYLEAALGKNQEATEALAKLMDEQIFILYYFRKQPVKLFTWNSIYRHTNFTADSESRTNWAVEFVNHPVLVEEIYAMQACYDLFILEFMREDEGELQMVNVKHGLWCWYFYKTYVVKKNPLVEAIEKSEKENDYSKLVGLYQQYLEKEPTGYKTYTVQLKLGELYMRWLGVAVDYAEARKILENLYKQVGPGGGGDINVKCLLAELSDLERGKPPSEARKEAEEYRKHLEAEWYNSPAGRMDR